MTEVAFHFGAPDKLGYAGRLLRKASSVGARLWVVADNSQSQTLGALLWAISPTSFLAHCHEDAEPAVRRRSAVMLASGAGQGAEGYSVLVNLGAGMPSGFERFERVIEVVSQDEQDRHNARQRWKRYTELGYLITRHDLNLRPGP